MNSRERAAVRALLDGFEKLAAGATVWVLRDVVLLRELAGGKPLSTEAITALLNSADGMLATLERGRADIQRLRKAARL